MTIPKNGYVGGVKPEAKNTTTVPWSNEERARRHDPPYAALKESAVRHLEEGLTQRGSMMEHLLAHQPCRPGEHVERELRETAMPVTPEAYAGIKAAEKMWRDTVEHDRCIPTRNVEAAKEIGYVEEAVPVPKTWMQSLWEEGKVNVDPAVPPNTVWLLGGKPIPDRKDPGGGYNHVVKAPGDAAVEAAKNRERELEDELAELREECKTLRIERDRALDDLDEARMVCELRREQNSLAGNVEVMTVPTGYLDGIESLIHPAQVTELRGRHGLPRRRRG